MNLAIQTLLARSFRFLSEVFYPYPVSVRLNSPGVFRLVCRSTRASSSVQGLFGLKVALALKQRRLTSGIRINSGEGDGNFGENPEADRRLVVKVLFLSAGWDGLRASGLGCPQEWALFLPLKVC